MATVVYLHVGAPKTGTTYFQLGLRRNRTVLARHGVYYPLGRADSMFGAAVDLIDRPWGGLREECRGEWEDLVARVRRCPGKVVISQEILAAATPAQVERALDGLGGAEVHLVYSARDLGRQIPSEWQEEVKHRRPQTFARFQEIVREAPRTDSGLWFWRVQGLPDVLDRWAASLPPSRVHLVTVPPAGSGRDVLWRRFCAALAIDPVWAPVQPERENLSIGSAEATLIRRLNRRLQDSGALNEADYRKLVRELVVQEYLVHRPDMVPVTLTPAAFDWAEEVAEEWIAYVRATGIDVIGELDDLRPVRPGADRVWADPDRPRPGAVTDVALEVIEALLVETAADRASVLVRSARLAKTVQRVRQSLRRRARASLPPGIWAI